jgi:hypothetical protein
MTTNTTTSEGKLIATPVITEPLFPGFEVEEVRTCSARIHTLRKGDGPPLLLLQGYVSLGTCGMWLVLSGLFLFDDDRPEQPPEHGFDVAGLALFVAILGLVFFLLQRLPTPARPIVLQLVESETDRSNERFSQQFKSHRLHLSQFEMRFGFRAEGLSCYADECWIVAAAVRAG